MIDSERVAEAIFKKDTGRNAWNQLSEEGSTKKAYRDMAQAAIAALTADAQPQEWPNFARGQAAQPADTHPVWKLTPDPEVGFVARSVKYPWCSGHGDTEEVAIKMASENLESLRCANCGVVDGDTGNGFSPAKGVNLAPEPLVYKDADAPHDYLSTACLHGLHDRCRKQCKFCSVACKCACHATTAAPGYELIDTQVPVTAVLHSWEQIEAALASSIYEPMLRDERGKGLTVVELVNRLRARLTARERVTVEKWIHNPSQWIVLVDGWNVKKSAIFDEAEKEKAEIYANGLRQELAQRKAAKEGQ
jgi:hypothetical protein